MRRDHTRGRRPFSKPFRPATAIAAQKPDAWLLKQNDHHPEIDRRSASAGAEVERRRDILDDEILGTG